MYGASNNRAILRRGDGDAGGRCAGHAELRHEGIRNLGMSSIVGRVAIMGVVVRARGHRKIHGIRTIEVGSGYKGGLSVRSDGNRFGLRRLTDTLASQVGRIKQGGSAWFKGGKNRQKIVGGVGRFEGIGSYGVVACSAVAGDKSLSIWTDSDRNELSILRTAEIRGINVATAARRILGEKSREARIGFVLGLVSIGDGEIVVCCLTGNIDIAARVYSDSVGARFLAAA